MDHRNTAYLAPVLLSAAATLSGILNMRADVWIPGLLSGVVSCLILFMALRGKRIKLWIPGTMGLFLALAILNAVALDHLDGFSRFALTAPLIVGLGGVILCCLIAYSDIRLDRVMLSTYFLFITASISNTFSFGVYYYALTEGVVDEKAENFWLVGEFAFVFAACLSVTVVLWLYLRRRVMTMVSARDLLLMSAADGDGADP